MEGKDNGVSYVKEVVHSVTGLEVAPRDWPKRREIMIRELHEVVGDVNFRYAIEDLEIDALNKPWTRKARFIAKAAEMYDIPFGRASKEKIAGK